MGLIQEELTHEEMVSAAMADLVDRKLLSIHGLVVNEDSKPSRRRKRCKRSLVKSYLKTSMWMQIDKAMAKEMDNLQELKVLTDVDVKSLKSEERGFSPSIEDPYAATPHMSSLKLLLTVAARKQWKITITDIQAAFLNAVVDVTDTEVIHVKPPRDFSAIQMINQRCGDSTGLKNSPRLWQKHLPLRRKTIHIKLKAI
eukprot:1881406-Amphidinium_carterae.4